MLPFELACLGIVVLTLLLMARTRPLRALLVDYVALAIAAWIGEDSCVHVYRHYAYADAFHARLHHVPLLVPLIWPLVILSARAVADALFPLLPPARRALVIFALVCFDASMVEVLAVRAGLWSWAEGGHLDVPVIGILGWGYFAAVADGILAGPSRTRHALALVAAPIATHLLLVGTWWGSFRHVLRGDLGVASSWGMAALGALALGVAAQRRKAGCGIALDTALPRVAAALLFFGLLVVAAGDQPRYWAHVASVAVPYLVATRFTRSLHPSALGQS
jgi:hypothetical protein